MNVSGNGNKNDEVDVQQIPSEGDKFHFTIALLLDVHRAQGSPRPKLIALVIGVDNDFSKFTLQTSGFYVMFLEAKTSVCTRVRSEALKMNALTFSVE